MKELIIIIGFVAIVCVIVKLLKKEREKRVVKYVNQQPKLTEEELKFYYRLNTYSKNQLILDKTASRLAKEFSEYADKHKVTKHIGVNKRFKTLTNLGATSVSEVYVGGFRTIETSVYRLLGSKSHSKTVKGNYTHVGVGVVGKHYTAIYFKI